MGSYEETLPDFKNFTLTTKSHPFPHSECFIPSTTPQCHASNLLILDNGDMLCAWFGGTQEGKPDISIYLSRKTPASTSWSQASRVTFDTTRSEQNPVLFQTPSGELWLLYTSQNLGDQDSALVKKQSSHDNGISWSTPTILFPEPGTFIRQPVIILDDGLTWVIPTFKCRSEPGTRWVGNDDISALRISQDEGKTWMEKEVPHSFGAVHMAIRQLPDKSYLAFYRSRWADFIHKSTSRNGIDWSEPIPTPLPNPNAGICFDVLPSGRILVVYNHSSRVNARGRREGLYDDIAAADDLRRNQGSKHAGKEAFWGAPRAPLCVGWSDDGGMEWKHRVLEEGDGFCLTNNSEMKLNRELSYPSIVVGKDGGVNVAFTYWRQGIKYVRFDPGVVDRE
ncbi:uncharacterized protein MYCFIDRAFT_131178 [Pseudocercospora fijiensis CIRAD86]|uniref:Sialidase domain-containing protein n=1 Tax=Pseudocercospora fijiensis (strain CIRAD86) TaxID=383855 RepID=M2Z6N4_PSEFD|nr:uncharacterized protein MYCFIDRAFT_131178 [Pseudocercospora fijiensis CIRAD86]EME85435.1 hypothetical protein MYCFIDRAFT_131178 [Pseudocercospora fijiensis CIRAD86]